MKKILKKLKTFCLEKNYLWLNPLKKERTPDGLLIYQDKRKHMFFSAEEFAHILHNLTGRKIDMEQITHYNMKSLHPRGNETLAWCWHHKKFFYFAPVGGHWIFIALTRQYECEQYIDEDHFFHASAILDKKYEKNVVFYHLILNYKVDTNQKTFQPLKLLLETKDKQILLSQYSPGDTADKVINDICNWQSNNIKLDSI